MRPLSIALLVSALLLSTAGANAAVEQTVTVSMHGRFYEPNIIRLTAGQPVTLRVVNVDASSHSLGARRFFASARIVSGEVNGGKIELAPGQSASVTLIPAKGRYRIECARHQMDRLPMQGQIIVQ